MKFFPPTPMPIEVNRSSEALPVIELSPEKVGEALNLEADEVRAQLKSVDGRKQLLADLTRNPETLQSVIDPDSLKTFEQDMEMTERDLKAEQKFLEAQKDPEKKGMFRRAWDTVAGFPRKHPVITVALLGVVLGVVASYMGWLPALNFGGLWGRVQGWFGYGAAGEATTEAVGETAAETAGQAAAETAAAVEEPVSAVDSINATRMMNSIGLEVPASQIGDPRSWGINIFEHEGVQHYLYNNQAYTVEQLPDLIKKLPIPDNMAELSAFDKPYVSITPYASSRPSAEIALTEALEKIGVTFNFNNKNAFTQFVPNPSILPQK